MSIYNRFEKAVQARAEQVRRSDDTYGYCAGYAFATLQALAELYPEIAAELERRAEFLEDTVAEEAKLLG